jgi:F0F1-type ATP synthase assembly protein I
VDSDTDKGLRTRRRGLAYQGAVEAVFAILVAALLGYWADTHFDTSPWFLLAGFGLGFAAFVVRLFRLGRRLQSRELEEPPGSGET